MLVFVQHDSHLTVPGPNPPQQTGQQPVLGASVSSDPSGQNVIAQAHYLYA